MRTSFQYFNTHTHTHTEGLREFLSISAWGVCEYSVNTNYLRWWWWLRCIRCVCLFFLVCKIQLFPWTLPMFIGHKLQLIKKTKIKKKEKEEVIFAYLQSHPGTHTQNWKKTNCYQINMNIYSLNNAFSACFREMRLPSVGTHGLLCLLCPVLCP